MLIFSCSFIQRPGSVGKFGCGIIKAKRSLLLVTSWVTSAIATLIAGITASPSLAATLASSEARVETNNFSYTPQEVRVLAGTEATALASDDPVFAQASVNSVAIASASKGSVVAQADANAVAPFDPRFL